MAAIYSCMLLEVAAAEVYWLLWVVYQLTAFCLSFPTLLPHGTCFCIVQELDSLQAQLRVLEEQLQESSQEVARLEGAARDLDSKAVQLQMELDEAQQDHQQALLQLQVWSYAVPTHFSYGFLGDFNFALAVLHCQATFGFQQAQMTQLVSPRPSSPFTPCLLLLPALLRMSKQHNLLHTSSSCSLPMSTLLLRGLIMCSMMFTRRSLVSRGCKVMVQDALVPDCRSTSNTGQCATSMACAADCMYWMST